MGMIRDRGMPVLVVAGTVYTSLVAADLVAAVFLTPDPPSHQGLYQAEEARGYAHSPGFSGTIRTTSEFEVSINSNGYRDREWTYDVPRRILVVGDSFTFGEPLAADLTIFYRLRTRLENAEVVIFNAGISGYGLAQILGTVRKECPVVRPERILYLFYLNDLSRDAMRTDSMRVVDGWLVPAFDAQEPGRALSDQEIRASIDAALHTLDLADVLALEHIAAIVRRSGLVGAPGEGATESIFETDDPLAYPPENSGLAAALLQSIAAAADACGAEFTMVILAADWELRLGVREPATERLLEAVADDGLDILDLRSPADPNRILRLPNDNHYNPAAADWAASRIANHLQGQSN